MHSVFIPPRAKVSQMFVVALLLVMSLCLPSVPAKAFGEGLGGALNAAATAAVAGYGAQAATTASSSDDDDDD